MSKERVRVSDEVKRMAIQQIRAGRPRLEVVAELGVSLHTINLWMSKDKKERPYKADSCLAAPHRDIVPTMPRHTESEETPERADFCQADDYSRQFALAKEITHIDKDRRIAELELEVELLKKTVEVLQKQLSLYKSG